MSKLATEPARFDESLVPERKEPTAPGNFHPIVLVLLSVATAGLIFCDVADVHDWYRPVLALTFFCMVPGAAVVRNMRPMNPSATYALALAISLAGNCAIAVIAVWARQYHPLALLVATGLVSVTAMWIPRSGR